MGESRTELIAWLNDLLQLNYTKIEQCGTGGAYCQIMDSIYGEQPSFTTRRRRRDVLMCTRLCLQAMSQ